MSRAQVAVEYNPLPRAEAPAPDAEAPGDEAAPAPDPACVFARFLAENVPARAVSLRGDGLGDGGARAVADALARNTWVLTLNLFDNGIGDAGGAAVVGAARYNTMLKTLSLSNNACGDGTAAAAAATLVGGPVDDAAKAAHGAAQESELPNVNGSDLGQFPLVSADFWTSDHLSERSRRVDVFSVTRARGTLTLKRR